MEIDDIDEEKAEKKPQGKKTTAPTPTPSSPGRSTRRTVTAGGKTDGQDKVEVKADFFLRKKSSFFTVCFLCFFSKS